MVTYDKGVEVTNETYISDADINDSYSNGDWDVPWNCFGNVSWDSEWD